MEQNWDGFFIAILLKLFFFSMLVSCLRPKFQVHDTYVLDYQTIKKWISNTNLMEIRNSLKRLIMTLFRIYGLFLLYILFFSKLHCDYGKWMFCCYSMIKTINLSLLKYICTSLQIAQCRFNRNAIAKHCCKFIKFSCGTKRNFGTEQ